MNRVKNWQDNGYSVDIHCGQKYTKIVIASHVPGKEKLPALSSKEKTLDEAINKINLQFLEQNK